MTYYHGSGALFKEFDAQRMGQNHTFSRDSGFFFTKKKRSAENYAYLATGGKAAGVVYEAELVLNNPVRRKTNSDYYTPADYFDLHSDDLLREVFLESKDSILIEGTHNDDLAVVFHDEQIKLVRIMQNNIEVYNNEPKPAMPLATLQEAPAEVQPHQSSHFRPGRR